MLSTEQINSYNEKGYLVVENAIPVDKLKELQQVTDDFVNNSREVKENDEIYDLSPDHSSENPNLRRLKNPHLIHKTYENITTDSCILDIVEKLVGKKGKVPLRKILKKYIPYYLIDRPKQGFGLPVNEWIRGPLKEWTLELMDKKNLPDDGLINGSLARKTLDEHLKNNRNWGYRLWPILMWQQWNKSKGFI